MTGLGLSLGVSFGIAQDMLCAFARVIVFDSEIHGLRSFAMLRAT
jgi:hypothetical protein